MISNALEDHDGQYGSEWYPYVTHFHQHSIRTVEDSFKKGDWTFYMDRFMMPEAVARKMKAYFKSLIQEAKESLIDYI
jgi:hypothetical protein